MTTQALPEAALTDRERDALKQAVVVRLSQIHKYLADDAMHPLSEAALETQRENLISAATKLGL